MRQAAPMLGENTPGVTIGDHLKYLRQLTCDIRQAEAYATPSVEEEFDAINGVVVDPVLWQFEMEQTWRDINAVFRSRILSSDFGSDGICMTMAKCLECICGEILEMYDFSLSVADVYLAYVTDLQQPFGTRNAWDVEIWRGLKRFVKRASACARNMIRVPWETGETLQRDELYCRSLMVVSRSFIETLQIPDEFLRVVAHALRAQYAYLVDQNNRGPIRLGPEWIGMQAYVDCLMDMLMLGPGELTDKQFFSLVKKYTVRTRTHKEKRSRE